MKREEIASALALAGQGLQTTNIKGKAYVQVGQRIKGFRRAFPDWTVETRVLHMTTEMVVIQATIKDETGRVMATGTAHEEKQASTINRTSFVENCETSAVGRALGLLGIGSEQICSAEELLMAIQAQQAQAQQAQIQQQYGNPFQR